MADRNPFCRWCELLIALIAEAETEVKEWIRECDGNRSSGRFIYPQTI